MKKIWRGRGLGSAVGERRRSAKARFSWEALERRELLAADATVRVSVVGSVESTGRVGYVGDVLEYTLSVTNQGDVDAHSVVLTDVLDPRARFQSWTAAPIFPWAPHDVSEADGVVTVVFPAILPGQTASVVIEVDTSIVGSVDLEAPIVNTFSITTAETNVSETTSGSVTSPAPSPVADLELTSVTTTPDGVSTPFHWEEQITYAITVTNRSTTTSAGAALDVYFPKQRVDFTSDHVPGWTRSFVAAGYSYGSFWTDSTRLKLNIDDLAPGESRTLNLKLQVPYAGGLDALRPQIEVRPADGIYDSDPSNNKTEASTPVTPFVILDTSVEASLVTAPVGANLTYRINLHNSGPDDATGIVVRQRIPAGTTFVSDSRGSATVEDGWIVIAMPNAGRGGDSSTLVTLRIDSVDADSPVTLSAPIDVSWDQQPNHDSGVYTLGTVAPRGYIGILLEASAPRVYADQSLTYSYTLSNTDTAASSGLTAVLTFPAASLMALVPGDYTVEKTATSQIVSFHLAGLAAGESRRLTVQAVALPPSLGVVEVVANLIQDGQPERVYPPSSVETSVLPWANVVATLSPDQQTIIVTNNGPFTATGVKVGWATRWIYIPHYQDPNDPRDYIYHEHPIGTLEVGQTVAFEIDGDPILDGPYISSKNEGDVVPAGKSLADEDGLAINLTSRLTTDVSSVETGGYATFTLLTTNIGPFHGKGLTLIATIPANSRLVAASPGVVVRGNYVMFDVASLPVGESASFQYIVSPTWEALASGVLTSEAAVLSTQELGELSKTETSATIPVTVGPAGLLVLGSTSYKAPETAGSIVITVNRVGGVSGRQTLDYATEAVDAVPGLNFQPVSGTLVFEDGETSRTITVPVLADPHSDDDRTARVVFSNGQAALLTIQHVDLVSPTVASVQWEGTARSITAITVAFTQPLSAPSALDPSAFQLVGVGRDLKYGTRDDQPVSLTSTYDPATSTVVLTPSRPLAANTFYHLTAAGGPGGLVGANGGLLAGDGLNPGADYVASLARGTVLRYDTAAGDRVVLRLRGAGYVDDLLEGASSNERLVVVNAGPRPPMLSRVVFKARTRAGAAPHRLHAPGVVRVRSPFRAIPLARPLFASAVANGSMRA